MTVFAFRSNRRTMRLEWSHGLCTGIDDIDRQHEELFRRNNLFEEVVRAHPGRSDLKEMAAYLESFAKKHCHTEESYMTRFQFPGQTAHCREHLRLVADLVAFKPLMVAIPVRQDLLQKMQCSVAEWLREHVIGWDRQLGEFVQKCSG